MSAIGGIGGIGGGVGGGGSLAGHGSAPDAGTAASTGPIVNEWMLRPQSFSADQVMDLRGAQVDAQKGTITYDKDFDFRGGGIGDDPIKDAIRRAAEEARRLLEAQQQASVGLVGAGATGQPQGMDGLQLPMA